MSTFDDREKAFENKYAHDAEMQWKAEARRNRLLGEWAAREMGMTDPAEIEAYGKAVVKADFEEAGDGDVVRKLLGDFEARAIGIDEPALRAKMVELLAEAKNQLMGEIGN
ncbi:MAG: DUF1476 domain-containing protein [Pseudomonadota bacterium]